MASDAIYHRVGDLLPQRHPLVILQVLADLPDAYRIPAVSGRDPFVGSQNGNAPLQNPRARRPVLRACRVTAQNITARAGWGVATPPWANTRGIQPFRSTCVSDDLKQLGTYGPGRRPPGNLQYDALHRHWMCPDCRASYGPTGPGCGVYKGRA